MKVGGGECDGAEGDKRDRNESVNASDKQTVMKTGKANL